MDDGDGGKFYKVEDIVRIRKRKKVYEFFIKWEGYPSNQNTWETLANLNDQGESHLFSYRITS